MKTCNKCGESKALEMFPNLVASRDGRYPWCRQCSNAYSRERYHGKKSHYAALNRVNHLRNQHGLTPEDYEEMLEAQGGVCAICRQPEVAKNNRGDVSRLSVDHDHETGRIRGLLCAACNRAIGLMRDDPDRLRAAAEYLEPVVTAESQPKG